MSEQMTAPVDLLPSERLRVALIAASENSTIRVNPAFARALLVEIDARHKVRVPTDDLRATCIEAGRREGEALYARLADQFGARYAAALTRANRSERALMGLAGIAIAFMLASAVYELLRPVVDLILGGLS